MCKLKYYRMNQYILLLISIVLIAVGFFISSQTFFKKSVELVEDPASVASSPSTSENTAKIVTNQNATIILNNMKYKYELRDKQFTLFTVGTPIQVKIFEDDNEITNIITVNYEYDSVTLEFAESGIYNVHFLLAGTEYETKVVVEV